MPSHSDYVEGSTSGIWTANHHWIRRGRVDGTEERTGSLKLGISGRSSGCRAKNNKPAEPAARASDEAVVSNDLAGHYNPPASQGPLDREVRADTPPYCPQGLLAGYRGTTPNRWPSISRCEPAAKVMVGELGLKPYWGKPAVRNFRDGRGNGVASATIAPLLYSAVIRG
jgi:hypothetical protein